MPSASKLLNEVIRRLAKKEINPVARDLKQANSALRKQVAGLNKRVADLEKDNKRLVAAEKKKLKASPKVSEDELEGVRVTARGVRALRRKWSVSQVDFGKLLGVSSQTVIRWEAQEGALSMRQKPMEAYVALRGLGAREAQRRIEELG